MQAPLAPIRALVIEKFRSAKNYNINLCPFHSFQLK